MVGGISVSSLKEWTVSAVAYNSQGNCVLSNQHLDGVGRSGWAYDVQYTYMREDTVTMGRGRKGTSLSKTRGDARKESLMAKILAILHFPSQRRIASLRHDGLGGSLTWPGDMAVRRLMGRWSINLSQRRVARSIALFQAGR